MNKVLLLFVLGMSFGGSAVSLRAAAAPRTPPPKASPSTPAATPKAAASANPASTTKSTTDNWEQVESKVLKVFSAKDGDNIYRSYLVQWNGQEVIVEDRLARTNYQVGDTIAVLVTRNSFPQGKESYGLLQFSVMPPVPKR